MTAFFSRLLDLLSPPQGRRAVYCTGATCPFVVFLDYHPAKGADDGKDHEARTDHA